MECIIRKRKREDCKEIPHIVTVEWNSTYKGIVSDEVLEELKNNESERIKNAHDNFDEKDNNVLVAVVDNKVVGF